MAVLMLGVMQPTGSVLLSNTVLPKDTDGNQLFTGETDAIRYKGWWYFYVNRWGVRFWS
jgi:hypothetical protein